MKDVHADDYRSFVHTGEAYYTKTLGFSGDTVDEVMFGLSCGGGGTHGEMAMCWSELGGKFIPQLHVFDDAWGVLASFTDLLAEMAEAGCASMRDPSITPKDFCAMLVRCGFKDDTPRKGPQEYNPNAKPTYEKLEKALKSIASMWPDPGMCAPITEKWIGPNDGKMRADMLWFALNEARTALGLPTYPRPEHWDKKKVESEVEE